MSKMASKSELKVAPGTDPIKILDELTNPHLQSDTCLKIYDVWADAYDKDVTEKVEYNAPALSTELTLRTVKDKDARIIDLAGGTGLGGEMLKNHGYTNMDILDASEAMLEGARRKQIYKQYICAFLGKNRLPIEDNTYDAAITAGSFVPGHVNHESFPEIIRIVKPGGFICIPMREDYLAASPFFEGFEEAIQKFKENGSWEIIEKGRGPTYMKHHESIPSAIHIFKVLTTKAPSK